MFAFEVELIEPAGVLIPAHHHFVGLLLAVGAPVLGFLLAFCSAFIQGIAKRRKYVEVPCSKLLLTPHRNRFCKLKKISRIGVGKVVFR